MIVWRERLVAFGIHFAATLALALVAAALIFLLWYPPPFATMIGGTDLFKLVVVCDLVLGPLVSLVIYDSRKSRRALIVDYTVVGIVQLAALVYGVLVVAGARPAYIAFNTDRFEVVSPLDIDASELAAATDPQYRKLPWTGPRYVFVSVPKEERQDALLMSVAGREEHQRPKFYRPYETGVDTVRARARPVERITKKFPDTAPLFDAAIRESGVPAERVAVLPIRHMKGFWTALIDTGTGRPVGYVDVDPYGN